MFRRKRPFRRRRILAVRRTGRGVEVSQQFSTFATTNVAGSTSAAPTIVTTRLMSTNEMWAGIDSAAFGRPPQGWKSVTVLGAHALSEYALQDTPVAGTAATGLIGEMWWLDGLDSTGVSPSLPLPNPFANELATTVGAGLTEQLFPKRVMRRRVAQIGIGAGSFIPTGTSLMTRWHELRIPRFTVGDRDGFFHTAGFTNSTIVNLTFITTLHLVYSYRLNF